MRNLAKALAPFDGQLSEAFAADVAARISVRSFAARLGLREITNLVDADRRHVVELHRIADDFNAADLSHLDLAGLQLAGIRWSEGTRWPESWVETIRRASDPLGGGT
ncbi:hypothetical protein Ate02nite_86610 [Paractinoplanes tereljensis]|uniref:Uncharacterized protein n=1 Tax=Paractinoplanes tereljensis TaxID=571912 RepID=A0A919NXU9_9ACTN|nr:hypothetical protein Ate02nite_86610 [Actinoplanes tereljensis]